MKANPHHCGDQPDAKPPSTICQEELDIAARTAHVPIEAAEPWARYYQDVAVWKQRCDGMLFELLASPGAYLRRLKCLKAKRDGTIPPYTWDVELEENIAAVRSHIMSFAKDNQGPVALAAEICGDDGSKRASGLIMELCLGGWLPQHPMRPGFERRQRDPKKEEQRQAKAEAMVDWMDEQSKAYDARSKAAGES